MMRPSAGASLGFFVPSACPRKRLPLAKDYRERATPELPSCLVLDVCLPGLDGLELQKALADREEQIIFVTGHGDVAMCAQAMKAGAVDFLTKPVDDEALLAAVSRALERSTEIRRRKSGKSLGPGETRPADTA